MVGWAKILNNQQGIVVKSNLDLKISDRVVIETDKGMSLAEIVKIYDDKIETDGLKILRIATTDDENNFKKNIENSKRAIKKCEELAKQYNLAMRIIDAYYTLDRKQLIFKFVADGRVDFRQLAKDLGATFKTRIELRQVGIRDEAKIIGGHGPCGRLLCCRTFLTDFDSVSINMAKNQFLSLNPNKINGVCGRLLCCLNYEDENYTYYKGMLPNIGEIVNFPKGKAKVINLNIFEHSYTVSYDNGEIEEVKVNDN